jgi:hypothetical protein
MSYPKVIKGESVCAQCGEIIEGEYLTVKDNHLIINYFSYVDGEDNIFCNNYCLANSMMAEVMFVEELEE